MANLFITKDRKRRIWTDIALELFFILGLQPIIHLAIKFFTTGINQMEFSDLFTIEFTITLLALFAIYVAYKFWRWHTEDKALKRNDFIDILQKLQYHQSKLSWYASSNKVLANEHAGKINKLVNRLEEHKSNYMLDEEKRKEIEANKNKKEEFREVDFSSPYNQ